VREVRRITGKAARARIARCGHDQHAAPERREDRVVEQPVEARRPEAQVDHDAPERSSGADAGDELRVRELPAEVGVVAVGRRLRIDADHADVVRGRADDRGDRRPVEVLRRVDHALHVERRRVRALLELGVREVEPGVDDGDGNARPGLGEVGRADGCEPPLVRDEWVRGTRVRPQEPHRLGRANEACASKLADL
jgi:hypothetical protein